MRTSWKRVLVEDGLRVRFVALQAACHSSMEVSCWLTGGGKAFTQNVWSGLSMRKRYQKWTDSTYATRLGRAGDSWGSGSQCMIPMS